MNTTAPERIKVFWQPGCSSCLRTKEFLAKNGVDFESIDVLHHPDGMAQLKALGARSVPIVSRGKEFTLCQSMDDVVKFLGLDTALKPALPPEVLYERLGRVLEAAIRFTRQFPADRLRENFRDRNRTLGDTAYHVFRVAEMGLQTAQGRPLTPEGFADLAPPDWQAEDIARWGAEIRHRLGEWWATADRSLTYTATTYYGDKPMHGVFERTVWHAAQHTRQLMLMLETHGIVPDRPLTAGDLDGLPVPDDVWG